MINYLLIFNVLKFDWIYEKSNVLSFGNVLDVVLKYYCENIIRGDFYGYILQGIILLLRKNSSQKYD